MLIQRLFGNSRIAAEGELISFRRTVVLVVATTAFYGVWLLFPWIPKHRPPTAAETGTIALGIAVALILLSTRNRWPQLAAWLAMCGAFLLTTAVWWAFRRPVTLSLYAVLVILAGLLLGKHAVLPATLVSAGMVLLLHLTVSPFDDLFWLTMIGALALLAYVTASTLELVDFWERELARRQQELISQLRDRQGELNRTVKALDEAYVTLQRTNDELVVARQEAEEARVLKEQFVANVSHELRTPLNLVVGFAEMMYLSPESYDGVGWTRDLESDIQQMYRASRHLQSLVNDILDLSRIDAARLPMFRELLDVREVITDAVETIAPLLEQQGLAFSVDLPESAPLLFVDRTRIRQVLLNLFNNAVRFTSEGSVTARMHETSDAVVISVQDSGVGIPADQLAEVFEEFRQVDAGPRSRGGTGLGLAVSRQFVELHGGRTWVESTLGQGSTFYFSLPLPGALPQTVGLERIPAARRSDDLREPIVVVDPDPSIPEMLSRYLGDHPVISAANTSTIESLIVAQHPGAIIINQPPDTPTEGWLGTLGELSERYGVPILRCSIPSPSWLQQSAGLRECLTKPVSREMLQTVLERNCQEPCDILVVDDNPGFLSLMTRMLGSLRLAAQVRTASTGSQALRIAHERRPELVFLDLLMPEMDGFEVLRNLRASPALADVAVVAVSATSYAEEALLSRGAYFTVTQSGGMSTGTLTELLNNVIKRVRPNYLGDASTSSSARTS
ncbi:MAG: hybrid sensor histidine kinase/response regulator [Anaerolineae bacterium]